MFRMTAPESGPDHLFVCHVCRKELVTTESNARLRKWLIFHGTTYGGGEHHMVLCPKCRKAAPKQ
jgi:uncharacterized protein YbaR (Trm112 family)